MKRISEYAISSKEPHRGLRANELEDGLKLK